MPPKLSVENVAMLSMKGTVFVQSVELNQGHKKVNLGLS